MGRPVVWATLVCERCQQPFRTKPCKVTAGRRFCSVGCRSLALPPPIRYGNQDTFRGDAAGRQAMHWRARKLTRHIVQCNRCPAKATLTHHVDENPRNNDLANLERLCRRCHITHHRPKLEAAKQQKGAAA